MFNKVSIIGCGLIGSSILRALEEKKLATKITAYDKSSKVIDYLKRNFSVEICSNISDVVKDSDLIVIASPLSSYKEIKHVNNWNKKMFNEFKKMKIDTNRSYGNFLLANFNKVKINSSRVFKLLAKVGILVRKMDVYGIKNSLRITIGKSEENRKLISKMKRILNV